ncbi:VWA domain-containing protein [Myxococcota bacterium]|nr:VWA domain-containing protein [Myxococcota bacterium]
MSGLLFGRFFYGLRAAGLPVGLSEWMTLMRALSLDAIEPDLTDFYTVARAVLVKTEAHFDVYDQVFLGTFGTAKLPAKAIEELLEWLADVRMMGELTPEMIAKMEALPLDELRKLFEERRAEQKERHDGGNRWIGTGGTSPFGNGGVNPAGVRVGGGGGNRTAIQIASARKFKEYRNDRVLDTRSMAVALKKLRRLSRVHGEPELDVEESIDKTCKNAGELTLEFHPPRQNEARVVLLMDVGGSMDPFTQHVEQLFSAAASLDHWRRFEAYTFHNCPYAKLEPASKKYGDGTILTQEIMDGRPPETFLIVVGDAYMAPSELCDDFGAIEYGLMNGTPGLLWLHRLKKRFPRAIWLNPIPKKGWYGWTIKVIAELFPMFELTIAGIEEGVDCLLKRAPSPTPDVEELLGNQTLRRF